MMRKRLLCVVLTLAMLFSIQPAAAAALLSNQRSTTITAKTRLPVIKVTVPSTGRVYLNPFKLEVAIDGEYRYDQILCTPCSIANESDIPLAVDVRVTGQINSGSDMLLSTSSTKDSTSTSKRAFVYFEIHSSNSPDPDDVRWDKEYDKTKHIVVTNSDEGRSKTKILTLAAKDLDGDVANGGYAAFRLSGDAIMTPKNEWTAKDGLSVEVAFTFTPIPYC